MRSDDDDSDVSEYDDEEHVSGDDSGDSPSATDGAQYDFVDEDGGEQGFVYAS